MVATLLRHLDRSRFEPQLALVRREGPFIADVPADVPIQVVGARRTATSVGALAKLFAANRPDVVFSTHGGANIIVCLAHALARSRARLVLSERSALVRDDRSAARVALELPAKRWTYRRADLITAVSHGVARELVVRLGLPAERVVTVTNPMVSPELDELAREPVEHPWFAEAIPIIVAVGRLVAIKDYPNLLAAFARVRACTPARLVVLGAGPLRDQLIARAAALGVGEHVWFAGFDKNPFRYMARARVMMHASRAEGLPGAIIQAMACGIPVVSTDCDFGPREVIDRPGDNGFLVRVGDVGALADGVRAVLAEPALRDRVGRAARTTVQRFTTAAAVAKYEAALAGDAAG